jgi:hypothetical protein
MKKGQVQRREEKLKDERRGAGKKRYCAPPARLVSPLIARFRRFASHLTALTKPSRPCPRDGGGLPASE